jgi:hypothetical protein
MKNIGYDYKTLPNSRISVYPAGLWNLFRRMPKGFNANHIFQIIGLDVPLNELLIALNLNPFCSFDEMKTITVMLPVALRKKKEKVIDEYKDRYVCFIVVSCFHSLTLGPFIRFLDAGRWCGLQFNSQIEFNYKAAVNDKRTVNRFYIVYSNRLLKPLMFLDLDLLYKAVYSNQRHI